MRYLQIRIAVPENVPAEKAVVYSMAEMIKDVTRILDPHPSFRYRAVAQLREGNVLSTAAWVKQPKATGG